MDRVILSNIRDDHGIDIVDIRVPGAAVDRTISLDKIPELLRLSDSRCLLAKLAKLALELRETMTKKRRPREES